MDSMIDSTAINTGVAFLFGFAIYYYFFVFGKTTPTVKVETKSREIKKTSEHTMSVAKKAENENNKEIKKTDPSVVKVVRNNTPSLAQYDATTATCTMSARIYIKELYHVQRKSFLEELVADDTAPAPRSVTVTPVIDATEKVMDIKSDTASSPKIPRASLAKFNATEASIALKAQAYVTTLPKPAKPFLAAFNATEATITVLARQYVDSLPKPAKLVLAAFNATEALNIAKAREYVNSLPKAPKPVLAAYNATVASVALKEREYINSLPKAPKPVLAAFNATEALATAVARDYINSLPKAPKPVLAAYNATTATIALKEREYVNSLPKAPKPVLAAYNATVASITLKEREYINSLPKAPKPVLAAVNDTEVPLVAKTRTVAKSLIEAPRPSLAAYNATVASATLNERKYIDSLPVTVKLPSVKNNAATEVEECDTPRIMAVTDKSLASNLASVEATQAYQLLQHQKYSQDHQQDKADSDIEVEIGDSSSPSTTASTSTSSIHSETNKFAAIAAASAAASAAAAAAAASASNKQQNNNNFYGTTWDKMFDEGIMNSEPLTLNNTVVFHVNNGEKKEWTRGEKIRKQSQSHMPKMRNRCDYWPACTNKNCKFSHPIAPCRVGDECPFGKRCSFIHPKDLVEPVKKRSSSTGTPKRNSTGTPKRAASSGGNTRNNNRDNTVTLKQ